MPLAQYLISPYSDPCLLNRVRDSVRGNDVIDWAENEFEPFLELFDVIRLEDGDTSNLKDGSIYLNRLSDMIRMHSRFRTSHVLITHLNENWGGFSTTVPNRSVEWGHWESKMREEGCSRQFVERYLDDPNVRAVVTPQHTAICHPSILSIPIGIQESQVLLEELRNADGAKTQELLINNSGWEHRKQINETVIENFAGRLTNSYGVSRAEYYRFIARSRFVLCPPGLGCDTYRLWETLMLGSIPIVERSPGWDSLLDDLPVLLVSSFDQVTPELLDSAYPKILSKCDGFQFDKLTKQWWGSKINELLRDSPLR